MTNEVSHRLPSWARQEHSIYNINLRRCAAPDNRFSTFSRLKENGIPRIQCMGFRMGLIMPLSEPVSVDFTLSDSPFSPLSSSSVDPRYLDTGRIELNGRTLGQKFRSFERSLPSDISTFMDFIGRFPLAKFYPKARAALYARGSSVPGYLQRVFSELGRNPGDQSFVESYSIFEQYYAVSQLRELTSYADSVGFPLLYDLPAFEGRKGAAVGYASHMLATSPTGEPVLAGWNLEHPDPKMRQVWGAEYDYDRLEQAGHTPFIERFEYWRQLGFKGFRGDAWHHFHRKGIWEAVAQYCSSNGLLFASETDGGWHREQDNAWNAELGNLYLTKPYVDNYRENGREKAPATPNGLCNELTRFNSLPTAAGATNHDTAMVPAQYRPMFGNEASPLVIASAIHTLFAMATSWWTVFQDDELVSDRMVHHPGKDCPWDGGRTITSYDISNLLMRLNSIRNSNGFLSDCNNLHWYGLSHDSYDIAGILPFARSSSDGKRKVITLVNVSGMTREGIAHLNLFGEGLARDGFYLPDMFSGKMVKFNPGMNLFGNGGIYYKLEPGQAHIFAISRG